MAFTKACMTLGLLGLLGLAAACGPDAPAERADPPQSARSTTSASPTPTPRPTAADGTDTSACTDGSCEVMVAVGQEIAMPADTTVKELKVTKVTSDRVELAGRAAGGGMSACYGRPPCSVSNNGGALSMTLSRNATAVVNAFGLTVESIAGDTAIISIEPVG